MITIARFNKPEEAHMLRLRLEAGGVPVYLQDENIVQMDWLYSNLIGGVRVQISEEDIEDAREILAMEPVKDMDAAMPACPDCASHHTAPDEFPRRLSFLFILLFRFPFLFSKTRWKCADCGRVWNVRNTED
ncbi:MAG: DUF2007 domain-containing protein [Chthoniobacterales bacterium]